MTSRTPLPIPPHDDVVIELEQRVWSGRFPLDVVRFRHRRCDGTMSGTRVWEVWRRGRAAALLPYDPVTDCVVLIEQFRFPALVAGLDPMLVELPAGLCEDGETPDSAIRREVREEAALEVGRTLRIGSFILSAGGSDEVCELFIGEVTAPPWDAEGVAGHAGEAVDHEDIRARVWAASRAIDAALAGCFPNSVTSLGLLWLASRRDWLRQEWKTP